MFIKVNSLKTEFNQLNKLIESYNLTVLNLYNELSYSNNYWQDGHSLLFYDNARIEKQNNLKIVSELIEIKDVYSFLISNYEVLGNHIKCELPNKYAVLNKIDAYINKIKEIIASYNGLDLSFCPAEAGMISSQVNGLNNELKRINDVRAKISGYYSKIEDIERTVNLNISKIDISYLKESDYRSYL